MLIVRNAYNYTEPKNIKERRLTSEHRKENNIKIYFSDIGT
jgi:hypothetical protein